MIVYPILEQTQRQRVSDGAIAPVLSNCESAERLMMLLWPQLGDFDSFTKHHQQNQWQYAPFLMSITKHINFSQVQMTEPLTAWSLDLWKPLMVSLLTLRICTNQS